MHDLSCFYNNQFPPLVKSGIPLNDLGLQRGYGIFDFLRVNHHIPIYVDDHINRFLHSAKVMRLPLWLSKDDIKSTLDQLIQKNNLPHSGVRILLTGGISKDGYQIDEPNFVMIQQPITPPSDHIYSKGYKMVSYEHQRQLAEVKTTDYLMAIWLQPWVKEMDADDILYHQNGSLLECPRSNFFIVLPNQTIVTPLLNILHGITRKHVLQVAQENGFVIEEREVGLTELNTAKEAFITSSTKRIIPITQIDDILFEQYTEKSVTSRLFTLLLQHENAVNRLRS
jgi:branched-chain amino acid aminotransferase